MRMFTTETINSETLLEKQGPSVQLYLDSIYTFLTWNKRTFDCCPDNFFQRFQKTQTVIF